MNFIHEPPRLAGRTKARGYGPAVVTVTIREKKRAVEKLAAVYSVHLSSKAGVEAIAEKISKALMVPYPETMAERAGMVANFVRTVSDVASDRVEALKARHPFKPLEISREMQRALDRAASARSIASESDGGVGRLLK